MDWTPRECGRGGNRAPGFFETDFWRNLQRRRERLLYVRGFHSEQENAHHLAGVFAIGLTLLEEDF